MNSFFMFSNSTIFLRFSVSIMVRMLQYISCPLSFLNPPAIFCRFFAFLKSLSLMLSSKGTSKSCRNGFLTLVNRIIWQKPHNCGFFYVKFIKF